MSNHEFENYLALVGRMMRLSRSQKALIRDELRDHLETRVAEFVKSGVDPNVAMRRALEEFGDAASLAKNFQTIFQVTQRRWMMRFATFSIAGTFLAAVLIMAMWPAQARFGSPSISIAQDDGGVGDPQVNAEAAGFLISTKTVVRKSHQRILTAEDVDKKLQQACRLDYDEVAFIDVMEELREKYDINILLDQNARDDSLTEDDLITFRIQNTRLSTALRLMLREKNATYLVHDGILRIISLDFGSDLAFFRRKIFDCRDLLEQITQSDRRVGTPTRIERIGNREAGTKPGKSGHGGGVFNTSIPLFSSTPAQQEVDDSQAEATVVGGATQQADNSGQNPEQDSHIIIHRFTAEMLLSDVIRTSVEPDSWDETNGDGTLMIIGGFMVVSQNQEILDDIESLIDELEKRMK